MNLKMELDPCRTAVIAVHCQGDIIGEQGAFSGFFYSQVVARNVVAKVHDLLSDAREKGATVVYTRVAWRPDYSDLNANSPLLQIVKQAGCLKDGGELAEIVEELKPSGKDIVITHQRIGGMTAELDALLKSRGIDTLLFSGVATNASVESSARQASDLGYRVGIVQDACSAATPEAHQASIESLGLFGEITTLGELAWDESSAPSTA